MRTRPTLPNSSRNFKKANETRFVRPKPLVNLKKVSLQDGVPHTTLYGERFSWKVGLSLNDLGVVREVVCKG